MGGVSLTTYCFRAVHTDSTSIVTPVRCKTRVRGTNSYDNHFAVATRKVEISVAGKNPSLSSLKRAELLKFRLELEQYLYRYPADGDVAAQPYRHFISPTILQTIVRAVKRSDPAADGEADWTTSDIPDESIENYINFLIDLGSDASTIVSSVDDILTQLSSNIYYDVSITLANARNDMFMGMYHEEVENRGIETLLAKHPKKVLKMLASKLYPRHWSVFVMQSVEDKSIKTIEEFHTFITAHAQYYNGEIQPRGHID